MPRSYEYKFVRLEKKGSWTPWVVPAAVEEYQESVRGHAKEGWRLVQIFAPGIGLDGRASYYELIFEREIAEGTA